MAAALAARTASLTTDAVVTVASRDIRLSDVVRAPDLMPAERHLIVARMPVGVASVALQRRAVAALIHRDVPRLTPVAEIGAITFRLQPASRTAPACLVMRQNVARGGVVARETTASVACGSLPVAALRFSRGAMRATADLAAGTYLGAVRLTGRPAVEKGDALHLVSTAGPVRVIRAVTALQDGRDGRRVFVRDQDGQVFAARLQGSGESE